MKRSDLLSIISTLDVKKATGLDGITTKILKSSAETVCPSLLKIIHITGGENDGPLLRFYLKSASAVWDYILS